jgi:hypothetical protein
MRHGVIFEVTDLNFALCFALYALASWRVAHRMALSAAMCLLEEATHRPQRRLDAIPVSKKYLDRVILGA